jgi:TonB family protein
MLLLPIVAASALSVALNDMNTATRLQRAYSNQRDQGSVLFETWIAPSGQVIECEVLEAKGSAELGSTFCAIYREQRITPAKDTEGNRAYSFMRSVMVLSNRRRDGMDIPADVTLTVDALPGRDSEYRLYANLLVDEQGAVQTCERHTQWP